MASIVKGLNGREICRLEGLTVDDSVASVKFKIELLTAFSAEALRLGIRGQFTADDLPLSTYAWKPGDPIVVLVTGAAKVSKGIGNVTQDQDIAPVEFGYLQIDHYREKVRGAKRWVPLPKDTPVHSYPHSTLGPKQRQPLDKVVTRQYGRVKSTGEIGLILAYDSANVWRSWKLQLGDSRDWFRRDEVIELDCGKQSCHNNSTMSVRSDSTKASASASRRVRFCDEVGSERATFEEEPWACEPSLASLAEWIFIDRDICGISLYEYAPTDAECGEFASSSFGHSFLEQLQHLQSCCIDPEKNDDAHNARADREERQFDAALLRAGVKAKELF